VSTVREVMAALIAVMAARMIVSTASTVVAALAARANVLLPILIYQPASTALT